MVRNEEIPVGDHVIAVSIAGSGPPIILCHGNSCSRRCFERQLNGALPHHHQVIALDWPGHGDSSRATQPARTYTLPGYAEVLIGLAEALELSDAVFVGWSLGGHIVLEASRRLFDAKGFLIFGTPPIPCPIDVNAFLPHPAIGVAFRAESPPDEVDALLEAFFTPGTPVPESFRQDFFRTDPEARTTLGANLGPGTFTDQIEIVANMTRPLAVLHGRHEQVASRDYMEALRMPTLWRGAIQEITDAGHAPHWESPRTFDALVGAFARDCGE